MQSSITKTQPINTLVKRKLATMVMDPNNSTPPNHFIETLKHRMSVYYPVKIYTEEIHIDTCTAK